MMLCPRGLLRALADALCTEQAELADSWKAICKAEREVSGVDDQFGSK